MKDSTKRDVAQDAISITSETMGHDFLAALLAELRQMPDHWARLNEKNQQAIIDRLKEKIRVGIESAVNIFMRGEFPAVQADLKAISWQSGITATLSVQRDALYRHALCDAQGAKVLVIIADAARWTDRMDDIKAKADQLELLEADYDPSVDQPGYRRDHDRLAAAPTWADLKQSLKANKEDSTEIEGEAKEPEKPASDEPSEKPDSLEQVESETPKQAQRRTAIDKKAKHLELHHKLASVGVAISLGALQALNREKIKLTQEWIDLFAADPGSCKLARPLWLPIPDKGEKDQ